MPGRLRRAATLLFVVSCLGAPRALVGQVDVPEPPRAGPAGGASRLAPHGQSVFLNPRRALRVPQSAPVAPLKVAALSALVPGLGQRRLGQTRGWAYAGLELAGWIFYADRRGIGGDFRTQYRDFAWNEARIQTTSRVDWDFQYYETLTKWDRSGAFDADPAPGIQPETDATTFNGSIWARAQGLFLPGGAAVPPTDPQYLRALEYYRGRAYEAMLEWDWTGTGSAQDDYVDLIRRSDKGFRQATDVLGAIIANHVLSSVDAYVSARGLATPEATRVRALPGPAGTWWSISMSWATPR